MSKAKNKPVPQRLKVKSKQQPESRPGKTRDVKRVGNTRMRRISGPR